MAILNDPYWAPQRASIQDSVMPNHPHPLSAIPRVVEDVEMWTEGDVVHMRVCYSDGTVKVVNAPIAVSGASYG